MSPARYFEVSIIRIIGNPSPRPVASPCTAAICEISINTFGFPLHFRAPVFEQDQGLTIQTSVKWHPHALAQLGCCSLLPISRSDRCLSQNLPEARVTLLFVPVSFARADPHFCQTSLKRLRLPDIPFYSGAGSVTFQQYSLLRLLIDSIGLAAYYSAEKTEDA